ncbi:MAG TPA: Tim44/TimA family putative adaptor protein [Stellaceae bacterium]|nr:Tim44/TimA family putative adaptor protein [Stellaceae bacterium]
MNDQIIDIILFAMVAGFLILRLRSVLGRRPGAERPPEQGDRSRRGFGPNVPAKPGQINKAKSGLPTDNVVSLPDRGKGLSPARPDSPLDANPADTFEKPPGTLQSGLQEIAAADPSFSPEAFLVGSRSAFDYIVSAFAAGDTAVLRPLLSDDVYDRFADEIRGRMAAKETLETRIVRLDAADLVEADLEGRTASITLKFVSQQTSVVRDADGKIIEGDPERPFERTDIWTFSRNVRSQNPNWALVATHAP